MNQIIEAHDVGVSLSSRPVLRDVDFSIDAGEVVALMGPNGSGKSTLVKAILGLHGVSRGEIRLFGTRLDRFRDWSRLSYVPQRSTIALGVPATVHEVVSSGRMGHRRPLFPARQVDRDAVRDAIAAVDLVERTHHTVSTLSGGQQQRVLMARALAGRPELLVLDEPNAGVDLGSQEAIADTLAAGAAQGLTILVVLHELGPFEPLIQRTLMMRQGRLVYDGPPDPALVRDYGHHHLHAPPRVQPDVQAPFDGRSH